MMFTTPARHDNLIDGFLMNTSKNTVYDINIRIVDVLKFREIATKDRPLTRDKLKKSEKYIKYSSLGPNRSIELSNIKLPQNIKQYGLNIFYTTRHNSYIQLARFVRGEYGRFKIASKVYRRDNNQIIHEQIAEKYPRNDDGTIEWEMDE